MFFDEGSNAVFAVETERNNQDYAFRLQLNEKPCVILGCPTCITATAGISLLQSQSLPVYAPAQLLLQLSILLLVAADLGE